MRLSWKWSLLALPAALGAAWYLFPAKKDVLVISIANFRVSGLAPDAKWRGDAPFLSRLLNESQVSLKNEAAADSTLESWLLKKTGNFYQKSGYRLLGMANDLERISRLQSSSGEEALPDFFITVPNGHHMQEFLSGVVKKIFSEPDPRPFFLHLLFCYLSPPFYDIEMPGLRESLPEDLRALLNTYEREPAQNAEKVFLISLLFDHLSLERRSWQTRSAVNALIAKGEIGKEWRDYKKDVRQSTHLFERWKSSSSFKQDRRLILELYRRKLRKLDQEIKNSLSKIPPKRFAKTSVIIASENIQNAPGEPVQSGAEYPLVFQDLLAVPELAAGVIALKNPRTKPGLISRPISLETVSDRITEQMTSRRFLEALE